MWRALLLAVLIPQAALADCVVLVHGLARSEASLVAMEAGLQANGFAVVNHGYPSTSAAIGPLARTLDAAVAECGPGPVDFVTHSMGGILVRVWALRQPAGRVGRVVMLAPPNRGSELVDTLGGLALFDWVNGPAGAQLGTGRGSVPRSLPEPTFALGVIAGDMSLNPAYSWIIPGADDGKVAVASTWVPGMQAHLTLPVTHTFMMLNPRVIAQTVLFLQTGGFVPDLGLTEAVAITTGVANPPP